MAVCQLLWRSLECSDHPAETRGTGAGLSAMQRAHTTSMSVNEY